MLPDGWQRVRRPVLGRRAVERDVARELRSHLDMKIEELIALGLSPHEAEEQARSAFGNVREVQAECMGVRRRRVLAQRRSDMWQGIGQDVRFGLRALRRAPGFTAVAVVTLALAIGANAAIFSAVDAVVLRPLPYRDPARLVAVALEPNASLSKRTIAHLATEQRSFSALAGYSRWGFTLTGQGEPELLVGAASTANLFALLGVNAMLGRTFAADEDQPGRENVAVLSYGLWVRRFSAEASVVGRSIMLDGQPHVVI